MKFILKTSVYSILAFVSLASMATDSSANFVEFQAPDIAVYEQQGEFSGIFILEPLELGMAAPMSRVLNRILNRNMEGFAIVRMVLPGIDRLRQSPKSTIETGKEIANNLSKVRLKQAVIGANSETVFLLARGQNVITAGDIGRSTNAFEVMNPELVIANITDTSITFELELDIEFGTGRVSSRDNKPLNPRPGEFGVTAQFSPVESFDIRADSKGESYDRLTIDITTDGSRAPVDLLRDITEAILNSFGPLGESLEMR